MSYLKKVHELIKLGKFYEALDILQELRKQKPGFLPYEQCYEYLVKKTGITKPTLRSAKPEIKGDIHILFVLPSPLDSNHGYQVQLLARYLRNSNFEITIAVPDEVPLKEINNIDFSVFNYSSILSSAPGPYSIIHAWTPREIVRRFCEAYLEKHNIPLIIHLEDNEEYLSSVSTGIEWEELCKLPIEELDRIIPLNRYHPIRGRAFLDRANGLTMVIETLNRYNKKGVPYVLLPPMADERLFYPRPINYSLRQKLGIPNETIVLCYTGNVHEANYRDVYELYKAVEMLNAEGYPTVLLRTGLDQGELTKDWPKNYVINFGFVKREEVPEIMAAADILVLPGGNNPFDNERFPSKLSEYFAMGKLTLISKYFLESYIKTYKKFIVLSSFCAEEVVEKIKQLIKNRQNQRLLFFDNLNISSYMQMLNQLVLSFPEKYKYKKIFSRRKRILIVDPVCANKYGHNLHAIRRYSNYLQRYFNGSEVVALVSKYLELNGIDTSVIKPILNFYYHPIIKIDNNSAKIEAEIESSLPIEDLHFLQIEKAKKDVFMFHEEYDLSNNDIVFYPSIDYYSIIGLLNYLDKTKPSLSPKYIFRWISVMEHNSFLPIKIESIFEKIRLKKCEGFKIINSAESIPYAKYLASYFQEPIIVTPTLIEEEFFDYESDKKYFRISFPGSGRPDKGIEKIPDILDNLESLGVKNIRVDLQFPDPLTLNALFHKILNLCQKSYVELQPFIISSESIMNNLRRADCVVLPYISDVYKYRSSAFVAECGVIGRPIVCSKGCGFSDEVEYFKIGFTAETPSEFAERIYELYSTPLEQRIITYKHTSYIYRKYIESCYRLLFMEVS